ncbi:MAG: replicative DNA helicase [Selenomonadaceae bacterium]|nr:replicative DNA helicase [Selenomonadaceae bacterium]
MAKRRVLPSAVDIEKKLLSAMMLKNGEAIPIVSDIINAEDFYRAENRIIFNALINIYNRGTPPDILLVQEELIKKDEFDKIGIKYLFSLIDQEFTTARAADQATTIKDKAILRRLISAGEEISDEAYNERNPVADILEDAEKKILSVTSTTNQVGFEGLSVILQKTFERIQHIHNHPGEMSGVTTGLIDLNKITNGLHKSDLILLAARPSMGKTALALNIAINAAKAKNVVAIFSLEMSKAQLGNRLLSTTSGVNSFNLNTGNLTDDEMISLINAIQEMEYLKLFIDDTAGLTLLELRSKVRRMKHEHGLDLIVIDYLQLMQGGRSRLTEQNRQQEISEISRNLKALAREMDVPILALSQLSRSVEMRAEKKPQLSDLRESGSLEQDADIVMFLYRDEYYNRDDETNENIAELIIAKNRNGPTSSIRLQFNKEIMRFGDLISIEPL